MVRSNVCYSRVIDRHYFQALMTASAQTSICTTVLLPDIRVRVAYGAVRHEISVNPQETFGGGVKKLLTAETGLRPGEQRLAFKGKERYDCDYLDTYGVKDRSKVVLIQDPVSIEKRYVEVRRNARILTVLRAISDVSVEIDKLAEQVSIVEKSIAKGQKVPEVQITTLMEMLMRQAVKLDNISAVGEAASSKNSQGKRLQTCVETLDVLEVSNAKNAGRGHDDMGDLPE